MHHDETSQIDIAAWVKSFLPTELWERYCHLSYCQMARIPELAKYADQLQEADKSWLRARRIHLQEEPRLENLYAHPGSPPTCHPVNAASARTGT